MKHYKDGHHATNYQKWFKSEEPYKIDYSYGYEPYLLVKAPFVKYEEAFIGYGQNKVSYGYELAGAGYVFKVLPDVFLTHAHKDATIGIGSGVKEVEKARKAKDWTVGWSCWREFTERVERQYGFREREPPWVCQYIWAKVYESQGATCIRQETK